MKKFLAWFFMFVMWASLTACGSSGANDTVAVSEGCPSENAAETEPSVPTFVEQDSVENRILIAYFTWADNAAEATDIDAVTSASVQSPGNVAQMAAWIQQETGGDLFSIQVEEPYSADYDECLNRAAEEKAEGARPELTGTVENMENYDTVFLGYPNWWYSAPMAVFSFLEENDLAGKKIVLFCSHGTGGLASSVKDISDALPDSQVESNVLGIYRDDISEAQEEINSWLGELGY